MGYPFWKYSKYKKENNNPFKQMKDRDMKGVVVVFRRSWLIQNSYSYYYEKIQQPSNTITLNYIANLAGRKGVTKYWTNHGIGGYIPYLTLGEEEYNRMKKEVERLGGKVELIIEQN